MSFEDPTRPRCRSLRALAVVATAIAAFALAACGDDNDGSATSGEGGSKPPLRIGIGDQPANLDPALDGASQTTIVHVLSNESLIRRNPEGELEPGLAVEWGYVGEGNRTFELTLRDDAKFSDGTPVDARAVKGWLEYFARAGGPFANALKIRSIEAAGADRVVINLAQPDANVATLLTEGFNWGAVAAPASVARPRSLGREPIGAGPYKLDRSASITGNTYVFVPNEHYYDPSQQRWSRVEVKAINQPSTMLQAVRAGQIDVALGDPSTAEGAESAGLQVLSAPAAAVGFIPLDRTGAMVRALGDRRVRQAMNYAIPREEITTALMGEFATPSSEWSTLDGTDPEAVNYYSHDPEKARELLAEAGYADGVRVPALVLGGNQTTARSTDNALAMAQSLREVGIELDITTSSTFPEFLQQLGTGRFPMMFITRGGDLMSIFYTLFVAPDADFNFTRYRNAELEELFRTAQTSTPEEAAQLWREMSRIMVEEALFLPDFLYDTVLFVDPDRVENVELTPQNAFVPLFWNWTPAGGEG